MEEIVIKIQELVKSDNTIIDCHAHCTGIHMGNYLSMWHPSTHSVHELMADMRRCSVSSAIVFPMPYTVYFSYDSNRVQCNHASGLSKFPYEIENEYMLKSIAHFGFKELMPFVMFSGQKCLEAQCNSIERLISQYNVYGIKYHPAADGMSFYNAVKNNGILALAKKHNIPFMVHTYNDENSHALNVLKVARENPDLRFCVAHYAGFAKDFYDALCDDDKNIFIDTSPSMCLRARNIYDARERISGIKHTGAGEVICRFFEKYGEHMLWGSDAPWYYTRNLGQEKLNCVPTYDKEVQLLRESGYMSVALNNTCRFLFGKETV